MVIGRLWRRAPAWRMCIMAAVTFTVLGLMFSPSLPRWPAQEAVGVHATPSATETQHTVARQAGGDNPERNIATRASYVPQPDPASFSYSTASMPPLAPGRDTIIPEAGRLVPLPRGMWQQVVLVRGEGLQAEQQSVLFRMEQGQLSGIIFLAAPGPLSGASGPVEAPIGCVAPDALVHQLAPRSAEQDPRDHECWAISTSDMTALADPKIVTKKGTLRRALNRLEALHVTVPSHMLETLFIKSDAAGWMAMEVYLPDHRIESPASFQHTQDWAGHFAKLFRQGYDGSLAANDITALALSNPES